MKKYKVAVIPGDGIGKEVVPEGQKVLEAAARKHGFALDWQHFDWSCDRFLKSGEFMPKDGIDQLRGFDAIYLGAVACSSRSGAASSNTSISARCGS